MIHTPTVITFTDEKLKTLSRDELIDLLFDYQRVETTCQQMQDKLQNLVLELDNKERDACNNPEPNNKPASHP